MTLIQWISLTGSIFFMVMVLWAVYRGKLCEAYALIWLVTGVVITVISVSGRLLEYFSKLVGIQTPAFALLLTLIMGMLLLLFQLTMVISAHTEKIKRLTQELTLLREELQRRK